MTNVSKSLFVVFVAAIFVMGVMVIPSITSAAELKNASPAFSVTWPDEWTEKAPDEKEDLKTLDGPDKDKGFSISIYEMGDLKKLEDAAAEYGKGLVESGIGSEFEIISNEAVETQDGSPAYFAETEWMYGGSTMITTGIMSAFKDGKWICVHLWTLGALEDEEMEILKSLKLE
ncbi:MAG: hypothetical protein JRI95_16655 [Deltaproteobacteria bacterium]|nr:hypothetical protein [Deltaproteobacteria bacterium]